MRRGRHRRGARGLSAERTAAAGGVILVLRFLTGSVLNYAFGLALAWLLVPGEFGVVSAAQNTLLLAAGVLTAGLPWALTVRMSASTVSRDDVAALLRTALLGNVAIATVLALGLVLMHAAGVRVLPTGSGAVLAVVVTEVLVLGVNAVLGGALQASRRFAGLGTMHAIEILVKCVVATVLVGVVGLGALGVAIGFLAGSLVATVVALRGLEGLVPGPGRLAPWRSVAMAGPIWVGTAGFTALLTMDVLGLSLLSAGAGAAVVLAGYQVCSTLARAAYFVSDALVDAVFPFMAAQSQDVRAVHRWFVEAVRWVPLGIVPLQLVLVLVPGPVLRLMFPDEYAPSTTVLRLLTLGTLGLSLTNALLKGLYARERPSAVARVVGPAVLLEAALLAVLVPAAGANGAAAAGAITSWVSAAALLPADLSGRERVASWPAVRLGCTYVMGLLPCIALMLVATRLPDAGALLLVGVALVVHALTARALGFLRDSDLARLSPRLPALLPVRSLRRRTA